MHFAAQLRKLVEQGLCMHPCFGIDHFSFGCECKVVLDFC